MILPSLIGGEPLQLSDNCRRLVIVGANGAGKTRFADAIASSSTDSEKPVYRLSALKALYDTRHFKPEPYSIDSLFEHTASTLGRQPEGGTQLERLLGLLLHDEMVNLFKYKANLINNPQSHLDSTPLDKVTEVWEEVFPGNRILIESGRMLFTRGSDDDPYSSIRLSDGERAVIYYVGAILYAPKGARVIVEAPEMFLHPTLMQSLWNRIELLRPDCMFIYVTHDLEFASSRQEASVIWVQHYDAALSAWAYSLLPPDSQLGEDMYATIIGSRKPVLFIEGDGINSIDAHLYPLVFKDFSVKSLGSCNKVIEATRTFNDLTGFHHLDSMGIVDRDRRDAKEVEYLRGKRIMVPEVAEIENILMLEEVVRAVAAYRHKDETKVFERVKATVMQQFRHDLRQQALLHTRHRVKRLMEYRVDGRFANISQLEEHLSNLTVEINPMGLYEQFCRDFRHYLAAGSYADILKVYNQKSMLPGSNVAGLCGLKNKDEYIRVILNMLRENGRGAKRIIRAIRNCFGIDFETEAAPAATVDETPAPQPVKPAKRNRINKPHHLSDNQRSHKHKRIR